MSIAKRLVAEAADSTQPMLMELKAMAENLKGKFNREIPGFWIFDFIPGQNASKFADKVIEKYGVLTRFSNLNSVLVKIPQDMESGELGLAQPPPRK